MLFPNLEAIIQTNRISIRNLGSGQTAIAEAPFSCGHLLVDDMDILEHACLQVLKQVVGGSWWSFPRMSVSILGRAIHHIERKMIQDALKNAGAQQVTLSAAVQFCDEQRSVRKAYVKKANRRR
jgi:hypothetical protein